MASTLTKRTTSKAAAADGGAELFDPEFEEAKALGKERTEKGTSWGSDLQYVFAAIGSAVGLGNFLRFPSLAYRYGGFGFLLPYALAIVLVGVPVMGMENMFGQMLQRSAVPGFTTIKPYLWGLGAYLTMGSFMAVIYYNVIMAWSLVYLVYSFYPTLPWGGSIEESTAFFMQTVLGRQDPETGEMWSLDDGLGAVQWHLAVAALLYWVIVFFCIFRGTKTVQKVVLVTVPLPFLIIFVLLFFGISREGSGSGIQSYVDPTMNPHALNSIDPWVDAVGQIFFGLSLCEGVMIAYASRQPIERKVVRNSWLIVIGNCSCSIIAGFAVFALLGHFSTVQGVSVDEIGIGSTFAVAFQTFPAAFTLFEGKGVPQLFAVLFFITLLSLGIDSSMSLVEAVVVAFVDAVPWCKERQTLVAAVTCAVGFLCSLIMCTKGGYDVLDIIDHYNANYMLLLGGAVSTVVVGWGYNASKLIKQVEDATGEKAAWLPFLWEHVIRFVTPAILWVLFFYLFAKDVMTTYGGYPTWAVFTFGWLPSLLFPFIFFGVPSLGLHFFNINKKPNDIETSKAIDA